MQVRKCQGKTLLGFVKVAMFDTNLKQPVITSDRIIIYAIYVCMCVCVCERELYTVYLGGLWCGCRYIYKHVDVIVKL